MGNFGIKHGTNLNTNTDLQLKLTTKYSTLKLYRQIAAEFTTDGSAEGEVSVSHGLNYTPIVQVWGKHTSQFTFLSSISYSNTYSLIDSVNSYRPYGTGITYSTNDEEVTIRTVAVGGLGGGALPSTHYEFIVLIFVDLSDTYSGASGLTLSNDVGFKVSKDGVNVFTGEEYEMSYSSKYRAMQYYEGHIVTSSLTLPKMWGSIYDTFVQEATYVDFVHPLNYPPLFSVFSDLGGSEIYELPYTDIYPSGLTYKGLSEISGWCDANRIRILFNRWSESLSGALGYQFDATTINIYLIIYAIDLSQVEA